MFIVIDEDTDYIINSDYIVEMYTDDELVQGGRNYEGEKLYFVFFVLSIDSGRDTKKVFKSRLERDVWVREVIKDLNSIKSGGQNVTKKLSRGVV